MFKIKSNIICSLDIGSSKICATCASVDDSGKINILGTQTAASEGIESGKIVDSEKLSLCIRDVCKKLRKTSGIRPRRIYLNIDSPDLKVKDSSTDVSLDRKVFYIDTAGSRSSCVSVFIPTLNTLIKCIQDAGLVLEGLVPSGCAQALAFFKDSDIFRKKTCVLIDIGASCTKLSLFKEGVIADIIVLSFGSRALTEEISVKLKLSSECAEELKFKYAKVSSKERYLKQRIIVKDRVAMRIIEGSHLYEAILPKVDYILQEIKKALMKLDCDYTEADELIATGGAVIMEGLLEHAERFLTKPIKMGFLSAVSDSRIQTQSALYATSIGLIHYGFKNRNTKGTLVVVGSFPSFRGIFGWLKDLYRDYF